eukprot:g9155.t1
MALFDGIGDGPPPSDDTACRPPNRSGSPSLFSDGSTDYGSLVWERVLQHGLQHGLQEDFPEGNRAADGVLQEEDDVLSRQGPDGKTKKVLK